MLIERQRERSRHELAILIAQVQEHPLCPGVLSDSITNALLEALPQAELTESVSGIEIFLAGHEAKARRQT